MRRPQNRHQRREARRIAALELHARRAPTIGPGGWRWAAALGEGFNLDRLGFVSVQDTTSESMDGNTSRSAEASFVVKPDQYNALAEHQRTSFSGVDWRGINWRMVAIRVARPMGRWEFMDRAVVTISLETTCPRDWTPADLPEHRR